MESGGLAEALLVENGVIAAVGTREKLAAARARRDRLGWACAVACVLDAHGHFRRRAGAAAGPAGGGPPARRDRTGAVAFYHGQQNTGRAMGCGEKL